jgi:hypothetical protein
MRVGPGAVGAAHHANDEGYINPARDGRRRRRDCGGSFVYAHSPADRKFATAPGSRASHGRTCHRPTGSHIAGGIATHHTGHRQT